MVKSFIFDTNIITEKNIERLKEEVNLKILSENNKLIIYGSAATLSETYDCPRNRSILLKFIFEITNSHYFDFIATILLKEFNIPQNHYYFMLDMQIKELKEHINTISDSDLSDVKEWKDWKHQRNNRLSKREELKNDYNKIGVNLDRLSDHERLDLLKMFEQDKIRFAKRALNIIKNIDLETKESFLKQYLSGNKSYPYFNTYVELFTYFWWEVCSNKKKPDPNGLEDMVQLVYLNNVDVIVSEEKKGFLKGAFDYIYGQSNLNKEYMDLNEFIEYCQEIQNIVTYAN